MSAVVLWRDLPRAAVTSEVHRYGEHFYPTPPPNEEQWRGGPWTLVSGQSGEHVETLRLHTFYWTRGEA